MRVLGDGVRCMPIPITRNLYWAGEDGSIWHAAHIDSRGIWRPETKLRLRLYGSTANTKDRGLYLCANLCVNGRLHKMAVHRLVAEAWLPDFHWLLDVHHVNGDCMDNRPANLACLTHLEHERLHGRHVADYDIVNARYDFELHRDDPRPDPFSKRGARPSGRKRDGRARARSMSNHVEQTIRRVENLAHELEGLEAHDGR